MLCSEVFHRQELHYQHRLNILYKINKTHNIILRVHISALLIVIL